MNRESFSNSKIAEIINKEFIPIKVDKEERPDIDAVYMMYLQATTGQGGWPLNVFLTPGKLEPFYGGTYWAGPDAEGETRTQKFEDVLKGVVRVWNTQQNEVRDSAAGMARRLSELVEAQSQGGDLNEGSINHAVVLDEVYEHFDSGYDPVFAGFTRAPKFPCGHNLSFLLRYSSVFGPERGPAMFDKVVTTLEKMGKGGIKDQIGHGFCRYSVTDDWNLPHFEKMLYDQALLLHAYLDGMEYAPNEQAAYMCRHYAEDIVEFLLQGDLASPQGAFFSAQDADSLNSDGHHAEGAYYVWTYPEFSDLIAKNSQFHDNDICAMYWNVQEYGNVDPNFDVHNELHLQNVLSEEHSVDEVARTFGKSPEYVRDLIARTRKLLLEYRQATRDRPAVDTKIITSYNGLAIGALARAATLLANRRCLQAAEAAAAFLHANAFEPETNLLKRSANSDIRGMVEDYSYLVSALLDLYEATFNTKYLEWARQLQDTQDLLFWDTANGGYFSTESATDLLFRPKTGFDGAEPSVNGVSAMNLYRLYGLLHDPQYERRAEKILGCYAQDISAQPFGYCSMLGALVAQRDGVRSVVIAGGKSGDVDAALFKIRQQRQPNTTVIRLDDDSMPFFAATPSGETFKAFYDKHASARNAQVLVCEAGSCKELD